VNVLSIVHSPEARTELFARAGHPIDEWSFSGGGTPPDGYDAYMVFGGAMHPDQDLQHPWLADEVAWLHGVVDGGAPVLGVCLGAQLVARACGAWSGRLAGEPEIGWHEVELTPAAASDPVFARLPRSFRALQWHYYAFEVPESGVELARSPVCSQAFRLGKLAWGVQFHPEVTLAMVEQWLEEPEEVDFDREALHRETHERIEEWNVLGRELCAGFLGAVERLRLAA
jgi:GMP synthase (glutamine-hydrolysing)